MQRQTNIPIKHEQQPNFDFSRSPALTHTHTHTQAHTYASHSLMCEYQSDSLFAFGTARCGYKWPLFKLLSDRELFSVQCSVIFSFFFLLFTLYLGLKCTSCSPVPPLCTVGVKCFRTQSQLQTPEARQLYKSGVEGGDGVVQSNCTGNALKIYFC